VVVASDEELCEGQQQWPITVQNMQRLGIGPKKIKLNDYDNWLYVIPFFFIGFSFMVLVWGMMIEARVEKRELELRLQREGHSINLMKYFKKSQDKFDKLEYLADLYKLIKENLDEINYQISENQRRTEEENRDNIDKMLYDKHSLLRELRKGKGDINMEEIRAGLLQMLSNLRFQDGRSLEEVYKQQMTEIRLVEEQKRLDEIQQQSQSDVSSQQTDSDKSVHMSEHSSQQNSDSEDSEALEDEAQEFQADPTLYDDLLKARQQFKQKRELFEQTLDLSLPKEDRDLIMSRYDDQMQKLEKDLLRDQEGLANLGKAKLAMRQKQNKVVVDSCNEKIAHTMGQIADLKKQIEENELEKDDIQETGINSKGMKKERDAEMRARMQEVDKEKDSRLAQMREDYMQKIKKATSAIEKEAILEEMGDRIKHTEEALEEDKKRQEANLLKLLKARQRKNIKQTVKKIDKETQDFYK
jgi:hypothetical protein